MFSKLAHQIEHNLHISGIISAFIGDYQIAWLLDSKSDANAIEHKNEHLAES
jgi:hypothetical protein